MIHFTTDAIAPADRFDHWREVRGKNLFGITIELPAEHRLAFRGSFKAHAVGNAVVSEMRASPYRASRTKTDIAHIAADSLCIGLLTRGCTMLDTGHDRFQVVGSGDMVISYSDHPHKSVPGGTDEFHYQLLKVPVNNELMLGQSVSDLSAARCKADATLSRPLEALFRTLLAEGSGIADPQGAVAHLVRLALVARGRINPRRPEVRAALRAGLYHAAREITARRKRQQDLTPAMVAFDLGISVRQLYVVFESAEQSFTHTLTRLRLEDVKQLLDSAPALSITQIAGSCGFDSLATFYRAFKRHYGISPNAFREKNFLSSSNTC
ncbi:AraC family transcriptional regulator [Castellaniella hirudinis]|uniref:AraC family transcriptional regulator n=1 Tax=Castellaniella hirudinis TaxID=1144617 RepID=A0ABV8S2M1_9BURK